MTSLERMIGGVLLTSVMVGLAFVGPSPAVAQDAEVVAGQVSTQPAGIEIQIPEQLLNRLVDLPVSESGPLRDQILDAKVEGWQSTDLSLRLDLKPSVNGAQMWLVGHGRTWTDTVGVTSQAAVRSLGMFEFHLQKPVWYEAGEWWSDSPTGGVLPMTRNLWAKTPVGNWPIIGPLADDIAFQEANRRRTEYGLESARHTWDRVSPRFSQNIDSGVAQLAAAMLRWSSLPVLGKRFGLVLRTSEEALTIGARQLPSSGESDQQPLTAWSGLVAPESVSAVHFAFHETALNQLLRFTELNGVEFSDTELEDRLSRIETVLNERAAGGRPLVEGLLQAVTEERPRSAPRLARFRLDAERPFEVRFAEGRVGFLVRGTLIPLVGPELPGQLIELSYDVQRQERQVVLVPRTPQVTSDAQANEELVVGAKITQTLLQQQVADRMKEVRLPVQLELSEFVSQLSLRLETRQVVARDGWLVIVSADHTPRPIGPAPLASQPPVANGTAPVPIEKFATIPGAMGTTVWGTPGAVIPGAPAPLAVMPLEAYPGQLNIPFPADPRLPSSPDYSPGWNPDAPRRWYSSVVPLPAGQLPGAIDRPRVIDGLPAPPGSASGFVAPVPIETMRPAPLPGAGPTRGPSDFLAPTPLPRYQPERFVAPPAELPSRPATQPDPQLPFPLPAPPQAAPVAPTGSGPLLPSP